MQSISGKIVAFITSLAVGFLIVINIDLDNLPLKRQLSAKDYKEAIDERNKLFKELEILEEENDVTKEKINSYSYDDKKHEKVVSDMLKQVKDYGMVTGLSAVTGSGVVIKIDDRQNNQSREAQYGVFSNIFHDNDAIMVLNEIRNVGGEAVALNNHRIIPGTSIECNWAFLGFDDDSMEGAPFYYYVIGDPEQLKLQLTREGSYINKLIIRKISVEIEIKEEIVIPASTQKFDTSFMMQNKTKEK